MTKRELGHEGRRVTRGARGRWRVAASARHIPWPHPYLASGMPGHPNSQTCGATSPSKPRFTSFPRANVPFPTTSGCTSPPREQFRPGLSAPRPSENIFAKVFPLVPKVSAALWEREEKSPRPLLKSPASRTYSCLAEASARLQEDIPASRKFSHASPILFPPLVPKLDLHHERGPRGKNPVILSEAEALRSAVEGPLTYFPGRRRQAAGERNDAPRIPPATA